MNNENSPFGSRSESLLDRAIDRAVRRLMEVDPPAGLRRRVLARIDAPAPAGWTFFPRYAAVAAAAAVLVLAVVFVSRPSQPTAIISERPAPAVKNPATETERPSTQTKASPAPDAPPQPKASARADEVRRRTPHREPIVMPQISNLFGPDGRRVSAANAPEPMKGANAANATAPGAEPIDIPALPVVPAAGQQKPEARAAAEARADAAPAPAGEARRANVSIELTVTEHGGAGGPMQKTVTMLVSDRQSGSLRSRGLSAAPVSGVTPRAAEHRATLNVDVRPSVYADNSILVALTLEYLPDPPAPRGREATRSRLQLHESMSLLLTSGKPILISEASDPAGNLRITVELKATVLQ
jgi:hypothetical protein